MTPTRSPARAVRHKAKTTSHSAAASPAAATNAAATRAVRPTVPAPAAPTAGGGAAARPAMMAAPPGGVMMLPAAQPPVGSRGPFVQMPTLQLVQPNVQPIAGCPAGLEYLVHVDQLLVHQQIQLMEMFTAWELENKYVVKNTMGQFIFMALEKSSLGSRCCCGSSRPFEMSLLDYRSVEVLRLYRPLRCDSCCCFCCLQEMEVHSPPGNIIGSIRQDWSVIFPYLSIRDSGGNVVLRIIGPFCTSSICCNDVVFDITARDGITKIGQLTKNFNGVFLEAYTDVDNFTVTFPMDLDVKMKATLLGAVFLIDYIFFENTPNSSNSDLPGNIIN
ncbi:phospholipid scramblase 2-like [Dermacentor variabilis]|uniref:phospholipid scramblase 2-like n=1 Tax=Dermacentor variabilis TaxID=34621 RepID=UPI003F5B7F44